MTDGVDTSELKKLIEDVKGLRAAITNGASKILRGVSFGVEKAIKNTMPVDTGRARASWGHWTAGALRKGVGFENRTTGRGALYKTKIKVVRNTEANAGDAIWKESELSITQGSNVVYIGFLNQGSSRKAPAGFIDLALLKGEIALQEFLGRLDPIDAKQQIDAINAALKWKDVNVGSGWKDYN